ncbi:pectin lyase fold/virulence factor [Rhizoctonia solani]|nr:pectin lyase fold/virulence factor [Rhizoctonia solani]
MRLTSAFVLVTGLSIVSANPLVQKRASTGDSASLGYATLSGGTAKVVIISGSITGNEVVKIGANTSVLGKSGATLNGVGLRVLDVSNVIIRNLKINKVLADAGDAIGVQASNRVWLDSLELWSDKDHNKDYYDGLLDITHGCYAVTVTNSYLHDHWKASLVGHSDNNEGEDLAIQVTYAYNYWQNLNSRTPSFRFGHGHIFNNYYIGNEDGINTRVGAELLVQNNVWEDCKNSVYSTDNGYANVSGSLLTDTTASTALATTWNSVGYSYTLKNASEVKAYVVANAGAKLSF